MLTNLNEKIQQNLQQQPGQTARQLATTLGLERSEVNSVLYADKIRFQKDSAHRWFLRAVGSQSTNRVTPPRTGSGLLARLCNYYLECLAREVQYEVNIWATSKYGREEYVELNAFPGSGTSALGDSDAKALGALTVGKRRNASRVTVLVGYPVFASPLRLKDGSLSFKLHPLFYHKVVGTTFIPLQLEELRPEPILSSFARLFGENPFEVLEEVRELSDELGLDGTDMSWEQFSETLEQLQHLRPDWAWGETCAPDQLNSSPPLNQVAQPGIYNRAIAWVTEEAPYTLGLREELGKLAVLEDKQLAGTALGHWLGIENVQAPTVPGALLEPLPLNSEQREAVQQAIAAPLTVVTGPPGTGKSQVLASIAVNAVHRGTSVIVASKNNRAVDVALERVNRLATVPVVLRLGANEHFSMMQEALEGLLGSPPDKSDYEQYASIEREYEAIVGQWRDNRSRIDQTVKLRNQVDELERNCENVRGQVKSALFSRWMVEDGPGTATVDELAQRLVTLQCTWPKMFEWLWRKLRAQSLREVTTLVPGLTAVANFVGLPAPSSMLTWDTLDELSVSLTQLKTQLERATQVRKYGSTLEILRRQASIESGAAKLASLEQKIAMMSEHFWRAWVATKPALKKSNARQELGRLQAVVRILAEPGQSREHTEARKRLVGQFRDLIHYLPAWAVTNLSVRGRVPLEPGIFDTAVIDEASQCDIASALPLLYRAKRAVIIGDPKQLGHISSLSKDLEAQLLEKYGLSDYPEWGYSINSLYDKAAGSVQPEAIVGLRDHHRSDAQIIGFSNKEFYEGRLRVATRHDRLKRPSHEPNGFRWLSVQGSTERPSTGSARNDAEADAVVCELRRLMVENSYEGSVGVVTPFRAQVERINDKLERDPFLKQVAFRGGITIDTVDRFQGDERDVILFSVVAATGAPMSTLLFLKNQSNRLNVALTRARAMLVVVGDRTFLAGSNVPKLAALAQYEPSASDEKNSRKPTVTAGFVSEWEDVLREALLQKGITSVAQVPVEQYLLDLAMIVGNRKLDIEIDGEAYHRAWDGERLTRDLMRDRRVLELGWDVVRFWVYEIRDNLDGCVARVQKWSDSVPNA